MAGKRRGARASQGHNIEGVEERAGSGGHVEQKVSCDASRQRVVCTAKNMTFQNPGWQQDSGVDYRCKHGWRD